MVEYLSGGRVQGSSTADADPDKTSSQFASGTWTSQGDSGILSESSGVVTLSVDGDDDSKDSGFTFDLGSGNVSDSTWTLRTKFTYTSNNLSAPANAVTCAFGIADSTTISGEGEANGNDIINPTIHFHDNTNNCYMVINSTATPGNNRTTRMTAGNTYYLQVQRVSVDLAEFKVFSDSSYETQVGTISSNTTTSSLTGGRYVFVHFFSQTISSGSVSASFSDWEFWNGLTTKDEKTTLTNVPANTRYEETDTRKIFRSKQVGFASGSSGSGSDWTEVVFDSSTAVNNTTASGNAVSRSSGSGWDSYIRSTTHYLDPSEGGGEVYFTVSSSSNISIGLEKTPFNSASSATYTSRDYSFHTTPSTNNIYENGSDFQGTAWSSSNDEFRITMDSDGLVKYYWRTDSSSSWTLERTSTVTASGKYYVSVSPQTTGVTATCFIKSDATIAWVERNTAT